MAPKKQPATLAAEKWFQDNPFFYAVNGFQYTQLGVRFPQTWPEYQEYHDVVYEAWLNTDGNVESKWGEHVIKNITAKIRKPWGIVMAQKCKNSDKKRKVGEPSSYTWGELKIYRSDERQRSLDALRSLKYRTTGGYLERQAKLRLERLKMKGTHVLPAAFDYHTATQVATESMTMPLAELNGLSALEYAKTKGGVYVFMTERQTAKGIEIESTSFLCKAANAVLRWNPHHVEFPNNICPFEERNDHGFVALTHGECGILGIDYFILSTTDDHLFEVIFDLNFSATTCQTLFVSLHLIGDLNAILSTAMAGILPGSLKAGHAFVLANA